MTNCIRSTLFCDAHWLATIKRLFTSALLLVLLQAAAHAGPGLLPGRIVRVSGGDTESRIAVEVRDWQSTTEQLVLNRELQTNSPARCRVMRPHERGVRMPAQAIDAILFLNRPLHCSGHFINHPLQKLAVGAYLLLSSEAIFFRQSSVLSAVTVNKPTHGTVVLPWIVEDRLVKKRPTIPRIIEVTRPRKVKRLVGEDAS